MTKTPKVNKEPYCEEFMKEGCIQECDKCEHDIKIRKASLVDSLIEECSKKLPDDLANKLTLTVKSMQETLWFISAVAIDYDGFSTTEELGALIDEFQDKIVKCSKEISDILNTPKK